MKNRLFAFLIVQLFAAAAFSQGTKQYFDLSGSAGSGWGSGSLSYNYNWQLGKNKKFEIGAGARFTSYFGSNQYYVTAPAKITSGSKGPGVLFKENIVANLDSFLLASAQVNSLNLSVNFGYHLTKKFSAGVNIDAIGFSFGSSQNGKYVNGTSVINTSAKPTGFNLLLVSDNDLGSLSSEAFAAFKFNSRWSVKAGIQFLFAEYTTDTKVQQLPEPNDRFRYKATGFVAGVRYQLH
jgi:hypothetical protein